MRRIIIQTKNATQPNHIKAETVRPQRDAGSGHSPTEGAVASALPPAAAAEAESEGFESACVWSAELGAPTSASVYGSSVTSAYNGIFNSPPPARDVNTLATPLCSPTGADSASVTTTS